MGALGELLRAYMPFCAGFGRFLLGFDRVSACCMWRNMAAGAMWYGAGCMLLRKVFSVASSRCRGYPLCCSSLRKKSVTCWRNSG
jgi:hypothetical protein